MEYKGERMSLTNKEKKKIDTYLSREHCVNLLKWGWCKKDDCPTCDQFSANDISNIILLMQERDDWEDFFTYLMYDNETGNMSFSQLTAWLYIPENFFKAMLRWIKWTTKK